MKTSYFIVWRSSTIREKTENSRKTRKIHKQQNKHSKQILLL